MLMILPGLTSGSHDTYPKWAAFSALRRGFRSGSPFQARCPFSGTMPAAPPCPGILNPGLRYRRQQRRPVVFNARGTGESPVATPQFYSASQTDDLRAAVRHLRSTYPGAIDFALLRASPLESACLPCPAR